MNGKSTAKWQGTQLNTKLSSDPVEDEKDPDVIPSQYGEYV
jgi:hypothetical protein